jgi:hypothetical protein
LIEPNTWIIQFVESFLESPDTYLLLGKVKVLVIDPGLHQQNIRKYIESMTMYMADSSRCALGEGSMDLDTLIMALYLVGHDQEGKFVTPEPLGPGGDPYLAMDGKPDTAKLDQLVNQTAKYIRDREEELLA